MSSVKFHIPCFSSMEQNGVQGGDSIIKSNIHAKRPSAKSLVIIFKDVFAKIKRSFYWLIFFDLSFFFSHSNEIGLKYVRITQKEGSFVFDPYEFCVNCLLNYHIQSQAARCGILVKVRNTCGLLDGKNGHWSTILTCFMLIPYY